jgi:spore maturation protein CgeB
VRFALFYHSARSDWNHGNAHFLRGMMRALVSLGHQVVCYEEVGGWSVMNLVAAHGLRPLVDFRRRFPYAQVQLYEREPVPALERRLVQELAGVDVVLVHEWPASEHHALWELLVRLRRYCGYTLLFHDTHYRILTQPKRIAHLGLERVDGVLAYGSSIAEEYRRRFGLGEVHVFHEAADVALFRPLPPDSKRPVDDAVFIGNWAGRDRAHEVRQFLLRPAKRFRTEGRRFAIYGVRYPPEVLKTIGDYYGVDYRGWLPNYLVPQAFAQARVAIHVVRRQYAHLLHGIPTIRVFEALACGVPVVSTRWHDTDHLFRAGQDFLVADTRAQMEEALSWLWHDETARQTLARSGLARVRAKHTCFHRATQLLDIIAGLRGVRGVRGDTIPPNPPTAATNPPADARAKAKHRALSIER